MVIDSWSSLVVTNILLTSTVQLPISCIYTTCSCICLQLESNEEQTTVQDDRQRLPSNRNTLQQYLQRLTDTNPSSRDSNEFSLMDVVRNLNLTSSAKNDTNDAVFTTASRQHLSRVGEPLRSHSRRFASTNSQLNSMEQHMRGERSSENF